MKDVGTSLAEAVVSLAPARHQTNLASQVDVTGWQTDGDDVVLVEHWPVQVEQSNIISVRLCQHVSENIWSCESCDNENCIQELLKCFSCVILSAS